MEAHKYKTDAGEIEVAGKKHKESENFRLHWLVEVTDKVIAKVQSAYDVTDTETDPIKMVWSALNETYPEAGLSLDDFNRTHPDVAAAREANSVAREAVKAMKSEDKKILASASSAEKTVALAFMTGMKAGKTEAEIVAELRGQNIPEATLKVYFPKLV